MSRIPGSYFNKTKPYYEPNETPDPINVITTSPGITATRTGNSVNLAITSEAVGQIYIKSLSVDIPTELNVSGGGCYQLDSQLLPTEMAGKVNYVELNLQSLAFSWNYRVGSQGTTKLYFFLYEDNGGAFPLASWNKTLAPQNYEFNTATDASPIYTSSNSSKILTYNKPTGTISSLYLYMGVDNFTEPGTNGVTVDVFPFIGTLKGVNTDVV